MKKRIGVLCSLLAAVLVMTACTATVAPAGGTAAAPQASAPAAGAKVFKIGAASVPGEVMYDADELFCKLVTERSNGELQFDFYGGEQLGSDAVMLEGMQTNLVQGVGDSIDIYAPYSADLNIMSMAFAFESTEHLYKYLESDYGKEALGKLEDQGFHIVNYHFEKNPRCFFGKKPITSPDDMKGMKFRIPNIPIWEKNFSTLGAVPTVIAWSEYTYALQQGVVDGGECTYENIVPMGFYEYCKYYTMVEYAYPLECICMATEAWNSLTPEQQKLVEECAAEASDYFNEHVKTAWEADKQVLLDNGCEFVEFDKNLFIDAMAPLAPKLESEGFWDTAGLYDYVQTLR